MGRPHRIDPEAGIHHIYTRGTKRWTIFHDDLDRQRFLGALDRVCDRYDVLVLAYCLMDNHVHLVLQFPQREVSAAMRDLKSMYARWFNDRHRSSGPIFEDRFGSKLVMSHLQLRDVVRYVHRNPYDIDVSMNLSHYRWSSHPVYLGMAPRPIWLRPDIALPLFSGYRKVVETPRPNDKVQNRSRNQRDIVSGVPGTPTLTAAQVSLADILLAVARSASCTPADVHPSRRNGLIGLAVMLAHDHAHYRYIEIYEPFGFQTASAAERSGQRSRQRMPDRAELRNVWSSARTVLWPQAA